MAKQLGFMSYNYIGFFRILSHLFEWLGGGYKNGQQFSAIRYSNFNPYQPVVKLYKHGLLHLCTKQSKKKKNQTCNLVHNLP